MKISKSFFNNDSGYALIYTFMVLILVTVLGVGLLTISANSMKITDKERQDQSVFYIAEGGLTYIKYEINHAVQNTYNEVLASINPKSTEEQLVMNYFNIIKSRLNTINKTTYSRFEKQNNQSPEALITVEQYSDNPLIYKLTSTGYLSKLTSSRTVSQLLTIPTPTFLKDSSEDISIDGKHAVIFKRSATISSSITGDISTLSGNLKLDWGLSLDGNINVNPNKVTQPSNFNLDKNKIKQSLGYFDFNQIAPPFPTDIFSNSSVYTQLKNIHLKGGTDSSLKLDSNSYIKNITIESNRVLDIYVGDTEKNLIVDNLNVIQGSINLIGSGKLNLYVKDSLAIKGYYSQNRDPNLSNIYYNGNSPLSFTGETLIGGSLFAKTSIKFENIGGGIRGNIVTTGPEVTFNGGATANAQYIIAPNAHVQVIRGAHVKGTVVADSATVSGGSSITYGESIIQNQPSVEAQTPTIIEQPMLEVD